MIPSSAAASGRARPRETKTLREDADFVLLRATGDELDRCLLLVAASDHPSCREHLEHEYAMRGLLQVTSAVRPLELIEHEGRPAVLYSDPGGELLSRLVGTPWKLDAFLRVAVGLACSLGEVHARDVVHQDVKPANILVNELTGQAWFLGFRFASLTQQREQTRKVPAVVAGTFEYMSPEQTGRTNRPVDCRSDLYALGVSLYEMLAGMLPFKASDPMEWIHCHLARKPPHPSEHAGGLPGPVAAIVLRLLNKAPEDRYQTARSIEIDLRRCLDSWNSFKEVSTFRLGAGDASARLVVPATLYGRQAELSRLLAAFDRVSKQGAPELVLVSGHSGVGKSALIHALESALRSRPHLFASGKFDQYRRDVPYATLAQAMQSLVRTTLMQNAQELARSKNSLQLALGQHGQLLVQLVPELELVLGKQAAVPELPPAEAQKRFKRLLCRFVKVFATAERPLALFLDDLQWADPATLDLVVQLLADGAHGHLLVVGAYRDDEVAPDDSLTRTLVQVRAGDLTITELLLAPLTQGDLAQMLSDTFGCSEGTVKAVARIVSEKTRGNPFFVRQLLARLHEEKVVWFDTQSRAWAWDATRIEQKYAADNVVELTLARLESLEAPTLRALTALACLGSTATSSDLKVALDTDEAGVEEAFLEAVRSGIIARLDGAYAFQHDRLQQATYEFLVASDRARIHLEMGRLLLLRTPASERQSSIFDIVNQLNRGVGLMSDGVERDLLAELDLVAGKRARAACAYASALNYFRTGRAALAGRSWDVTPSLAYDLDLHCAECEYLTGDLQLAEQHLTALAARPLSLVQHASVSCARIKLYTTLYRYDSAREVCLTYLRTAGMPMSAQPSREQVEAEFASIWARIGDRPIEALIDLPAMESAELRATMEVLVELEPIASLTERNLVDLVVGRMVNLSLEHGHWDGSCLGYMHLALVLSARNLADHGTALRFGLLAYELAQRGSIGRFAGRISMTFGAYIAPWLGSVRVARAHIERASELSTESGDVTFAVFCGILVTGNWLASGDPLSDVQRETEAATQFASSVKFEALVEALRHPLQFTRMLRGLLPTFGRLDDRRWAEHELEAELESSARFDGYSHWIFKLMSRVLSGHYAEALEAAEKALAIARVTPMIDIGLTHASVDYHFFAALAHAACYNDARVHDRPAHVAELSRHQEKVSTWAAICERNFAHRASLLAAELARIDDRPLDAERLYEEAINLAREERFVQVEAIAAERAALFHSDRRLPTIARAYLRQARSAYGRWGADGKVRQLDELYPALREHRPLKPAVSAADAVEGLDIAAALKMSRAVSSEIELGSLIDRLMSIALEHGCAERGLLIRLTENEILVEAEATTSSNGIAVRSFGVDEGRGKLPESIVRYVVRKREAVILDDGALPNPFSSEPYLAKAGVRSLLCLPLLKQATLCGVLYLENTLAAHVFTPARSAVLGMLASQAAISLENARLYLELREENRSRHEAEAKLKQSEAYLAEAQTLSGTGSFGWNVTTQQLYCSDETYRLLGLDPCAEHTLEQVRSRVHPDDLAAVTAAFESSDPKERNQLDFEHRVVLPDGSLKRIHVVARAAKNAAGEVEFVGAAMDVTEQRRAQMDLEKSEEALSKVRSELARVARVTSLGVLTASIAHEVNQPLTGIVTNAGTCLRMLANEPPNIEGARETARRMIRDGNRAADVITRLRAMFAKSDAVTQLVDLNDAAREVVALLLKELQRNRAVLSTELASDLPLVQADRVQLQQVILNLLLNASDAMSGIDDRPRHMVLKTEDEERKHVRLTVRDAGVGLEPENEDRVFDAFYTTKPGGMGIGLSVSRSIIESHHGRLWASSNDGPGATFGFSIPLPPGAQRVAAERP